MQLRIGENLKTLRRQKGITQEQLAHILGVSFQSVSRWENDTCYPDIELLPIMADYFETTVDSILRVEETVEKERVKRYLADFQDAVSRGQMDACIRIARAGVEEFPNNHMLLNKLMYALFLAGDEDGNIPDWQENMQKYDAEITALGERIMKYCPDQDIRLEATGRLAFNHCEMGRKKQGRAIYETLPPMALCKENQIWWGLDEEEQLPFLHTKIRLAYESLRAGMYTLTWLRQLPDVEVVEISKKILALDALIFDGAVPDWNWGKGRIRCNLAKAYIRLGETEKALEQLEEAARFVKLFDERTEKGSSETLLLGHLEWSRKDFETDDNRSNREIMRDKWLADPDFDPIRHRDAFHNILKVLK